MLQCVDKCLIVEHGLVISFFLFLDLLQEQFLLDEGVVELGVGIAELVVVDEELKPLSESGLGSMVLGERGHELGVFGDEHGVEALGFEEVAYQLINEPGGCPRIGTDHVMLLALVIEKLIGFLCLDILGQLLTQALLQFLQHAHAPPWR